MSRHLDQVLAHAENQLASTGARRPTEVLPLYKKFLTIEEHRLRLQHQAGAGGREVCSRRANLIDVLLKHVFAAATTATKNGRIGTEIPLALIALGGYGRGELNPFSDVDVMFLHEGKGRKVPAQLQQIVEQILYLLWDIGFKVGHSTRSIKEAITEANRDMLTKTAMLESRFVAGNERLANAFRARFRTKCVEGYERQYVEARMEDQAARHAKFGDSVYMQEPNVKNGCGGLRDYQNLLWMTYFKEGTVTTTHLVGKDWLSEPERRRLEAAYDFLLRVRTDLHYATKRATEVLRLNMQEQVAQRLNYGEPNGQLRSEAFMRDYYEHSRNIFRVTERITEQFVAGAATDRTRSLFSFLPLTGPEKIPLESFLVRQGKLFAEGRDVFEKDPLQMMRVFQLAQEKQLDLSPELEDLLNRSLGEVTRTYQYGKAPREIFLAIMSNKGEVGRILRLMHRVDFLGRYLPEFGQLTCLVQHEFFHRYTADEHTLVCIDKLDALIRTEDPKLIQYRKLFEELPNPFVLYLALLLHDTGKAVGARPHSEASAIFAQRVARRLQLDPRERKMLILLVDHHLTLSNIAQRRNIDDPVTVSEFAAIVKDQKNLDALMLLTLADGQGTSDENWSDWKETLVWQLYRATSQYLADRHLFYERAKTAREARETLVQIRLGPDYTEEIEAHFDFMPDHYFRAFKVADIVAHVELFRRFYEATCFGETPLAPVFSWERMPEQGHTVLTLCSWDRQELLSKIAGSISVVPLNILSADIYTRGDNVALDVFRVSDPRGRAAVNEREMALVESALRKALEEEAYDLSALLAQARKMGRHRPITEMEFPSHVSIDNQADPYFSLIEIQTPDRI